MVIVEGIHVTGRLGQHPVFVYEPPSSGLSGSAVPRTRLPLLRTDRRKGGASLLGNQAEKLIQHWPACCSSPITTLSLLLQPMRELYSKKLQQWTNRQQKQSNRKVLTEEQHVQRKMTRQSHLAHLLFMQEGLQDWTAREMT